MSKVTSSDFKASALGGSSSLASRPAATSSPSPAPSQTVASQIQSVKNRQPAPTSLGTEGIHSQPADTGAGLELMTQVTWAIKYLKERQKAYTFDELISYLSLHILTDYQAKIFAKALRDHPSIAWDPAGADGQGTYSFKSRYDIHDSSQLLRHLQSLPTFQGLPAHDLVEGWANSEEAIRKLQIEHKVLVLRSRKDDKAKMVWLDDPTLSRPIEAEFRDMWSRIKLPDPESTATELERNGLLPANKSKKPKIVPKAQEKKPRKIKRSGRVTNDHMRHLLKDFSGLRK